MSKKGGVLIEFLIALPIFIVFIVLVILVSTISNAHTSLDFAVSNGTRQGITRGLDSVNESIDSTKSILDKIENDGNFDQLFYHNLGNMSPPDNYKSNLLSLSKTHRTILALINQYMSQSVGSMVKFPCDPDDIITPDDNFGCMNCYFRSEIKENDKACFIPLAIFPYQDHPLGCGKGQKASTAPSRYINITCRYLPDNTFIKIIGSLIGYSNMSNIKFFYHTASIRHELPTREWIYE